MMAFSYLMIGEKQCGFIHVALKLVVSVIQIVMKYAKLFMKS